MQAHIGKADAHDSHIVFAHEAATITATVDSEVFVTARQQFKEACLHHSAADPCFASHGSAQDCDQGASMFLSA